MEGKGFTSGVAIAKPAPAPFPAPRTQSAPGATKDPTSTLQPMEMGIQKPASAAAVAANPGVRADLPNDWGLAAMPLGDAAPYSRREGSDLIVCIVANKPVVFTQRFAEKHASDVACELGLAGRPVIKANNRPHFPVDPGTFLPLDVPTAGCKWMKEIIITTRG